LTHPDPRGVRGPRDRVTLITVAVAALVNVLSAPAEMYPGDPRAIRAEAVHLLTTGEWGVPASFADGFGERGQYFFENVERGRWFPKYGVLNTVVYVPVLAVEWALAGRLPYVESPLRVPLLNLFNVLLAAVLSWYLIRIGRLYTDHPAALFAFVMAVFYATYLWNYLRAQSSEILQVLLFTVCYYHLTRHLRAAGTAAGWGSRRHLLGAALAVGALVLVKTAYVALLPIVGGVAGWGAWRGEAAGAATAGRQWRPLVLYLALPLVLSLVILGAANEIRFGTPFTSGYAQWARESDFLSGSLATAAWGYLATPHGSVLLHFPPLLLAALGWPAFLRRHPREAWTLLLVTMVMFLVNGRFVNWRGENCYGPRYMLFVLPLLSLPLLLVVERLIVEGRRRRLAATVAGVAAAAILVGSAWLQLGVNSLPFLSFYRARAQFVADRPEPQVAEYFARHTFGRVGWELIDLKHGRTQGRFAEQVAPKDERRRGPFIERYLPSNYYWFPGWP